MPSHTAQQGGCQETTYILDNSSAYGGNKVVAPDPVGYKMLHVGGETVQGLIPLGSLDSKNRERVFIIL